MALRRSLTRGRALVALLAAACSHGEPFPSEPADPPNDPVLAYGMQRLTFGLEGEWAPAFTAAGDAFGFTWRLPNRDDRDRCLGVMPLSQLRIATLICHGGRESRDSMNAVFSQAFSAGGQVAYVQAEGPIGRMASARVLAVRDAGASFSRNIVSFPLLMPDTQLYQSATHLAWVNENTIAFLATSIIYETGVPEATDTTEAGIELARVDLALAGAPVTTVPNTRGATAFAIDPSTGTAYLLLGNVVYSVDLVTGARTVALDLSALSPVRDFTVSNGRLVAIVQGASSHFSGRLAVADLPGGTPTVLSPAQPPNGPASGFQFGRPALAPTRDRIVAEAFTYQYVFPVPGSPVRDTIVNHASDLYLITVP